MYINLAQVWMFFCLHYLPGCTHIHFSQGGILYHKLLAATHKSCTSNNNYAPLAATVTTWNSRVFGFATWTAGTSAMSRLSRVARSSREHNANVRHSVKPAAEMPSRSRSVNLLRPNCSAMQLVNGGVRSTLLKPYAIATSSMMSHAWMTSCRVGGISNHKQQNRDF